MNRSITELMHGLLADGQLELGHPGEGSTPDRLARLASIARTQDLAVARLVEAHVDAVSILHEAGRQARPGVLYGVWASQTTTAGVRIDHDGSTMSGSMGFASGLGIVDRALVTVAGRSGSELVDVDVAPCTPTISVDTSGWSTPALAASSTGAVTFDHHPFETGLIVGQRGWYLDRPGFWQGACGPAACWAGGALGIIDAARPFVGDDPHRRAHHGAMTAHAWQLGGLLDVAGRQIDDEPDSACAAERTARSLRFIVADICRDVMDRFGRAFGPRPSVGDADVAQRLLDLGLYITQHHAERELPELSSIVYRQR